MHIPRDVNCPVGSTIQVVLTTVRDLQHLVLWSRVRRVIGVDHLHVYRPLRRKVGDQHVDYFLRYVFRFIQCNGQRQ
ncbi:MAG: hypothetical protein R6U98_34770 [Pirellulaceae bacterium]